MISIFKKLFVLSTALFVIACSDINNDKEKKFTNEYNTHDISYVSGKLQSNLIDIDELGFINEKEIELTGEGKVICKLIAYKNEISENSAINKTFDKIAINIKYPEFVYVIKEDSGFHNDTIDYTRTINYLIKLKAMSVYLSKYGVYFSGINCKTDYDIKLIDNNYLSIMFKVDSVESTRYTNKYAINIDLRNEELYTPVRYALDMDRIGTKTELKLSDLITKEEAVAHFENNNYKIYFENKEVTNLNDKQRIILALKDNIDSYFDRNDKFYITKGAIGFISDEVAHKGNSNEVLIPR